MFGNLRSLIAFPKLSLASLTQQRGERAEGERLFEEADYEGAELHLAQAIVESEQRQETPNQRISLRLELGEAQRRQFLAGGDPQKLTAAEETVPWPSSGVCLPSSPRRIRPRRNGCRRR